MAEGREDEVRYAANGPPTLVIAGTFAITAFSVAVVSGLMAGRGAASLLGDALGALLVCWPIGYVVGKVANVVVTERIERHKRERPIPDLEAAREEIDAEAGIETVGAVEEGVGEVSEAVASVPGARAGANASDAPAREARSPV